MTIPDTRSIRQSSMLWFSPISLLLLFGAISFLAFSKGRHSPDSKDKGYSTATALHSPDDYADLVNDANLTAFKRDQYACKKGTPCKTNACCGGFNGGDTGECGLGPAWCGSDCDSQCDAKVECGSWANPPGKKCPLNVCCSEFGFCGSTTEFCTGKCQTNCVLEPKVPAGGSSTKVLNKVIGYYGSWASYRTCRNFPPSAIPVDGLTHVNFAFAYIDPTTYQITTMDSKTPQDLFTQTADIRSLNSDSASLQVFISIGGWTFSDNGTSTQSVFPDIASDAGKRQKFSNNLVSFMRQYGFDGVDIDWEYPGAPDRGGQKQDTANYVLLLETMRKTFDSSGRGSYGISFTIPSSYWYLRWFDIPSMVKYVDWINLMTYDLHGVWDRDDPIGSIVQGHTNLTEIKQSVDLLWRNDVPPGKVVLGLGFYGRSFQLSDTSCSTPGCGFKTAAAAGACTANPGTLAYFEIMDVISSQKPNVIHDNDAGVNYFVYGDSKDQWVSYDDAKTFQQKVDFANSVGLGGVMIWSVDQDDNDFSALSGLVGKSLPSFANQLKRSVVTDTGNWASQNGQKCMMSECMEESNNPNGFALAPNGGPFPDNCGRGKSKWIYCPLDSMPSRCEWRGSGSCHGQCHAAETTLFHSKHGSYACLAPGLQAFCCASNTWTALVDNCGWTGNCDACPSDRSNSVSHRKAYFSGKGSCTENYCCGYNFQNCHWIGKGTCDDNECSNTDVEVALDPTGDTGSLCGGGFGGGRSKVMCCNPPKNLNPFLPVSLDKLFPTLPPADDLPHFDLQQIDSGPAVVGGSNPQVFGLVVIDGPEAAVSSLSPRDGSHLEFLSCDQDRGTGPGVAQFVCMDTSDSSNCDDMHKDGLAGTILRMPEDCGFATYSVAHSVTPSLDQNLPGHLRKRAPPGALIYDLEYSYDFQLAKRDSGDIFIRIDYSDSHAYYDKIVAADPVKGKGKRDLHPRYWSDVSSIWKSTYIALRSSRDQSYQASLKKDDFNVLLFGDDGSRHKCPSGKDGFLKLSLSGSVKDDLKWGVTLVGTISPSLVLEEAYSYFDSDLTLDGTLDFDGKGVLNIDGSSPYKPIFSSPITNYQFSHPGIVSFSPQLNVDVQLLGSGQIDGKFTVNFAGGSSKTMSTNAPLELGDFGGQAGGTTKGNAFTGDVSVNGSQTHKRMQRRSGGGDITAFAIKLNLETQLHFSVFNFGTTQMDAGATLAARVPHVIRVIGGGNTAVNDADLQATSDVVQNGSISSTWTDDVTHRVGGTPLTAIIHSGDSTPPDRNAPAIDGFALFGERDWVDCSSGSDTKIKCLPMSNMLTLDPSLANEDDNTGLSKRTLESRAGQGGERTYEVHGPGGTFEINSHTYPNGRNGATLRGVNPAAGYYDLENEDDCVGTAFRDDGDPRTTTFITEHILELQTLPRFLEFAMGVPADIRNGVRMVTRHTPIPQAALGHGSNFLTRYSVWDPHGSANNNEAPVDEIYGAFGDTLDPSHLVNAEEGLNAVKMRIWRGAAPIADTTWTNNQLDDTSDIAHGEQALSTIRNVAAVYGYLNTAAINQNFATVIGNIRTRLETYQLRYNAVMTANIDIVAIWDEYIYHVLVPQLQNSLSHWVGRRLNMLSTNWNQENARNPNSSRAPQIRALITQIHNLLDEAEIMFIDTSRFGGNNS